MMPHPKLLLPALFLFTLTACAEGTKAIETSGSTGGGGAGGESTGTSMPTPLCGNGQIEAGEICDGNCPALCPEDGDACTLSLRKGDAATCDVTCATETLSACQTGDGCCPAACDSQTDADCEPCDIRVPKDAPTINEAITMAPSPGVVCIGPGVYAEDITLRPHVSLRGSGQSTEIIGHISMHSLIDPDPTPTHLRDLVVRAAEGTLITACPVEQSGCLSYLGVQGKHLALSMQRVHLRAEPSGAPVACLELETYGGSVSLEIEDSQCVSNTGMRFVSIVQDTPVAINLRIARSRFEAMDQAQGIAEPLYLLVMSASGDCGVTTVPAGTQVRARLENNEFVQTKFAGVHVARCLAMTPEDAAQSNYLLTNNTFLTMPGATGDDAYGVWIEGDIGLLPHLAIANNLFFRTNALPIGGEPADVDITNLRTLVSPFQNLEENDLRLLPGSAPIDKATALYAPKEDKLNEIRPIDGNGDQSAEPDIGAHEYKP